VEPERDREERRHLSAGDRIVRAEVPSAAASGDARGGERLDESEELGSTGTSPNVAVCGAGLTWSRYRMRAWPKAMLEPAVVSRMSSSE